ncbi:AbrB/MazE/SpoVT family DNA-binding domain-containing protein [Candidatus Kuenenbacteria bacterium]|nr:AbrB/MazE/SpoVT family DNA-binding domain-containing protein [Candidatus Kuenenbacteria bacterium]
MKKGVCTKKKLFYGMVTLTDKGQLAIPIDLRRELGIDKGDKLIVVKRKDGTGLNLIKAEAIDHFLTKISKD